MIVTFDSVLPKTVAPTYSWDDGIPSSTNPSLLNMQVDSEGYYIGYAPFALIRLSSAPVFEPGDESVYTVYRKINFGDYYNCSQNQLTSLGFDEDYYCHVYVMPGTYEVGMTYTKYTTAADVGEQQTILYQQESFDIEQAPVLDLITENDRGRIYWRWNKLTCDSEESGNICDTGQGDLTITPITWKESQCSEYYSKTWKDVSGGCFEAPPVLTPSDLITNNLGNKIKVVEITPTAYLSAVQPVDPLTRISPLSATLTARFTRCGSFPIEKITWDLGDGSPILTQRRWAIDNSYPFVFTGAISTDPSDPRNYDVKHVYTVTKNSGYTFYPSITCHAYSTGTTDCASTVIGPIRPQQFDSSLNQVSLLQNNLNDQKSFAVLLQVGDDATTAKFEI